MAIATTARARTNRDRKVSRTYRLRPERIAAAQRILGVATATEAIETALDMIVFRHELIKGNRAMRGTVLTSPDPDPDR